MQLVPICLLFINCSCFGSKTPECHVDGIFVMSHFFSRRVCYLKYNSQSKQQSLWTSKCEFQLTAFFYLLVSVLRNWRHFLASSFFFSPGCGCGRRQLCDEGPPLLPLQSRGIRELQVTRNKWWRLVVNRIGTQRKSSTIVAKKPQCRCVLWLPIISDVCSSEISTPMQKLTSFVCVTIRWNWFVYRW